VLQSQVLDRIRVQSEHGISIGLVAAAADEEHFRKTIVPVLDAAGVKRKILSGDNLASILARSVKSVRALRKEYGGRSVYVRGMLGAIVHAIAFPVGGPRLVYDFRGDGVAESEYRGRGKFRRTIIDLLVRLSLCRASAISCVSNGAASVLADRYGRHEVSVIPSCVDFDRIGFNPETRNAVRKELDLQPTDIVLAYIGGVSRYQQIPQMLQAWRTLSKDNDLKFLLLTNNTPTPDGAAPEKNEAPAGTIIRRGLSRDEVTNYMMAADVGFMLRESHPLNSVASPVKFAEYLSAGLAVVTSPGLGDVSSLIVDRSLGVLVDPDDETDILDKSRELLSSIRSDRDAFRQRSINAVRELLDWKAHLSTWRDLLDLPDAAEHGQ